MISFPTIEIPQTVPATAAVTIQTPLINDEPLILAEFPMTAGELHAIGQGNPLTLASNGQLFSIRFLLRDSFQIPGKNFVVNRMVAQIVTKGLANPIVRQQNAVRVKVQTVEKVIERYKKPEKEKKPLEVVTVNKEVKRVKAWE